MKFIISIAAILVSTQAIAQQIPYTEQVLQNMIGNIAGENARCAAQVKDLTDRLQRILVEKTKDKPEDSLNKKQ